ncbi:MAG: hypothetical protein IKE18_01790 [Oscillospiraceae bacterium]|nr:hypothetical protein [Oscillospiraceae bacterium]
MKVKKPIIIGVVHLPFYGTADPKRDIREVEEYVVTNVRIFFENGIDHVIIQDENIVEEKASYETLAVMSAIGRRVKLEMPDLHLGIIVQAHDPKASIAIAHACGAEFVRIKVFAGAMIKAEGIRTGVGPEAAKYRTALGATIKILTDVHDREGTPVGEIPITDTAGWAERMGSDCLIITGKSYDETKKYLREIADTGTELPVIVGGSVKLSNISEILDLCDGAVVSSSLMCDGGEPGVGIHWDADKVREFADAVKRYATSH